MEILIIISFFVTMPLILGFLARRSGFRKTETTPGSMGPVLFFYKWGSVRIGAARYGRNVRITAYKKFIHLRLMRLFGGGEILLPMKNAKFSFSRGLYGEVVDIEIGEKTYGFGRDVAKMVRKHYYQPDSETP
ncbi:hypothetical protein DENIS_1925 [Desulfonema ishimotonii]|uniref:Uncharacterized protein n=1 Tax=Desulfonema ishimotonii TaxID=45657 RepID=A0A401FVH6_9BACT|nr:hypothetical protein [Desulfonema ishimotonii]GBC60965.1 hypothetical protein DENIS_1925 [Desulfonema ishimotonii]